jgi:hypothetical protein
MGWVVFRTQVAQIPRLSFFRGVLTSIIRGFFLPFTLLALFFFPLGCWLAFGLVGYTECTSEVWVGGAATTVVWLAAECWIDNCCNCLSIAQRAWFVLNQQYHRHVVQLSV